MPLAQETTCRTDRGHPDLDGRVELVTGDITEARPGYGSGLLTTSPGLPSCGGVRRRSQRLAYRVNVEGTRRPRPVLVLPA